MTTSVVFRTHLHTPPPFLPSPVRSSLSRHNYSTRVNPLLSSPRVLPEEMKAARKINLGRNDAVEHSVNWLGKKTRGEAMGQRKSNARLSPFAATFTKSSISYHCNKCTNACHGRHSDLDAAFGAVNRFDLCTVCMGERVVR